MGRPGRYLVEIAGGPILEVAEWSAGGARTLAWVRYARMIGRPACEVPQAFGETVELEAPVGLPEPDLEERIRDRIEGRKLAAEIRAARRRPPIVFKMTPKPDGPAGDPR